MGCMVSSEKSQKKSKRYYSFSDIDNPEEVANGNTKEEEENGTIHLNDQKKSTAMDLTGSESANSVNSVYANITMFEELNKESSRSPSLIKISRANIDPNSKTFTNVSFFEKMEATARQMPDLDGGSETMKLEESKIRTTVSNFENLVQLKNNDVGNSKNSDSSEKITIYLNSKTSKGYSSLNKIGISETSS